MTPGPLQWLVSRIELMLVIMAGRLFGLSVVVRYLRNPNPLITVGLLRAFGAHVGEGASIKGALYLDNAYEDENSAPDLRHLRIGRRCYIGEGVLLDLVASVTLSDEAVLSGRVSILTHADCNRSSYLATRFPRQVAPVTIGKGAWLGYGATILAGADVGENAVVAAHALLRKPADAYVVYGGSPATEMRRLEAPVPALES